MEGSGQGANFPFPSLYLWKNKKVEGWKGNPGYTPGVDLNFAKIAAFSPSRRFALSQPQTHIWGVAANKKGAVFAAPLLVTGKITS